MIQLIETNDTKMPSGHSIIVKFNYNEKIISIIKEVCSIYTYDKITHNWEVPINNLAELINRFSLIDDIDIKLIKDEINNKLTMSIDCPTTPYPYQIEGIEYMLNNPNCLLLDAP